MTTTTARSPDEYQDHRNSRCRDLPSICLTFGNTNLSFLSRSDPGEVSPVAQAVAVEFFDRDLVFSDQDKSDLTDIIEAAAAEARSMLPGLPVEKIRVTVESDPGLAGGEHPPSGIAWSASRIGLYVHPLLWSTVALDDSVELYVRNTVLHELHHVARGWLVSNAAKTIAEAVVSEGMAVAFARDVTGFSLEQRDTEEIHEFIGKLLELPPETVLSRRNMAKLTTEVLDPNAWIVPPIAYDAGTYIVDLAMAASGLSAAELVSHSAEEILELAGFR